MALPFAELAAIAYTVLYVAPFYLSPATRPSPHLSRDSPTVIRARIRAVTISCILSSLVTLTVLTHGDGGGVSASEAFRLLGYWPPTPVEVVRTLLLTAVLFAGPLFEKGIVEGEWRGWIRARGVREELGSWIGWRNYVAGPVSEEIVFRSALVPLHLLAGFSPARIVFLTPLYFGIAHIHHLYEYRLTHPHTPFLPALFRSLIQFGYTSVFGFYATFIFLRTASLPAAIFAHSFCNWCGLPRVWGRVEPGIPLAPPPRPLAETDEKTRKEKEGRGSSALKVGVGLRRQRLGLGWTVMYYVLLVAGALGFWKGLWVLTESDKALVEFS